MTENAKREIIKAIQASKEDAQGGYSNEMVLAKGSTNWDDFMWHVHNAEENKFYASEMNWFISILENDDFPNDETEDRITYWSENQCEWFEEAIDDSILNCPENEREEVKNGVDEIWDILSSYGLC